MRRSLLLTLAEVLELKCDPLGKPEGTVIESQVKRSLLLNLAEVRFQVSPGEARGYSIESQVRRVSLTHLA